MEDGADESVDESRFGWLNSDTSGQFACLHKSFFLLLVLFSFFF